MKISVIAPMYNEKDNIDNTLFQVQEELKKNNIHDYEIIFVNDGSTDDSWDYAKQKAAENPQLKVIGYKKNRGRGNALITGFDYATGDIIVTIDFDLSYDVTHISRMVNELIANDQVDVVLTSCYMPGGKTIGVAPFRLFISKTANLLYRYAYKPTIYTSTCVVRAYRKKVIKSLLLESEGKEIHLEILSKLIANNFKIKEIPGTLTKRKAGKSSFKFRAHSISHILFFIQERPFAIFGLLGIFLILLGLAFGGVLLYTRFGNNADFNATFFSKIVSPTFILIVFLTAFQIIGLGFLGIQNSILKKELFKIQKQIKNMENK